MRLLVGFVLSTFWVWEASLSRVYTNHWAVRIPEGPVEADKLASKYGFTNLGQVSIFLCFKLIFLVTINDGKCICLLNVQENTASLV